MRIWVAPALLAVVCLSGCGTPVTTVEEHAETLQGADYGNFVARRTVELQQMGGPFTDRGVAEGKAMEEARSRYGEVPAPYTSTTTWGKRARAGQAQSKVQDTLEKMDRDATRR